MAESVHHASSGDPEGEPTRRALGDREHGTVADEVPGEGASHRFDESGESAPVRDLISRLLDSSATVRLEAASSLGKLRDRRAVRPLMRVLDDAGEDPDVCAAAIMALACLGDVQVTDAIAKKLGKDVPNGFVRAVAARALGDLRDAGSVPPLVRALRGDPISEVRRAAAEALMAIGGLDADRALRADMDPGGGGESDDPSRGFGAPRLPTGGHSAGYIPCRPSAADIHWLESRSMLHHSHHLTAAVSGNHVQWRNAYARPRPQDFVATASVWFTSYPKSLICEPEASIVGTLGSPALLSTLHEIGIEGIHTGPMKRAGGITGRSYTSSVDGFFDRIELSVDPLFGSDQEYVEFTNAAKRFGISVIGDLVPAHTGKGADFRLAERGYQNYPGLYTMVEIPEEDWQLLGDVPDGADSVNLPSETVRILEDRGYIPGVLEITPFYYPGVKETDWSATDVVACVDGRHRRWVYLHVFKPGQPSLNWLDPTFAAQRVVLADGVQSLHVLGDSALRIDASPLLGVEVRPGLDKAWIEGHPLAEGSSNLIAMMIRKLGGYSFQEINASVDDLKRFVIWGPDLSYDFITRTPYLYAMVTGDAAPLRMMLRLLQDEGLDPGIFVHALQNHDELMFDLSHLRRHGDEEFTVGDATIRGKALYDKMYKAVKRVVIQDAGGCMREFSNLGFCGTLTSFAAAACGISDPYDMTSARAREVQQLHLLAAVFNAMQPGVFALSGWDLVGALPVSSDDVQSRMEDEDYRWLNRGAFDLMGANPIADVSIVGLPKAKALYGPLPDQLRDRTSFASRLSHMLRTRKEHGIARSRLVAVPEPEAQGLLVMLLQRPQDAGWIMTTLNFGREGVCETVHFPRELAGVAAHQLFSTDPEESEPLQITTNGECQLALGARSARVFAINGDSNLQPTGHLQSEH